VGDRWRELRGVRPVSVRLRHWRDDCLSRFRWVTWPGGRFSVSGGAWFDHPARSGGDNVVDRPVASGFSSLGSILPVPRTGRSQKFGVVVEFWIEKVANSLAIGQRPRVPSHQRRRKSAYCSQSRVPWPSRRSLLDPSLSERMVTQLVARSGS